jgi:hypothetical protein
MEPLVHRISPSESLYATQHSLPRSFDARPHLQAVEDCHAIWPGQYQGLGP